MSDFSILFAEREEGRGSYGYPGSKAVPGHRAQSEGLRERNGTTYGRKLLSTLLDWTFRLLVVPDMVEAEVARERRRQMMDHERQERDLQEIFDATRASYLAAIENTFALQERTLEFARTLIEAPQEALRAQAEDNRARLETLAEESRRHREAMENLVRESAKVYESFLGSPFSHHQHHQGFEEAKGRPKSGPERGQGSEFPGTLLSTGRGILTRVKNLHPPCRPGPSLDPLLPSPLLRYSRN